MLLLLLLLALVNFRYSLLEIKAFKQLGGLKHILVNLGAKYL